jgi:hypothetical protein
MSEEEHKRYTTYIEREFNSLDEMINAPFVCAKNQKSAEKFFCNGQWIADLIPVSRRGSNLDWVDHTTYAGAAARVHDGWPEGAQRVINELANISVLPPVSIRRKLSRGDQGDELDIHSVSRGQLDRAWTKRQRREVAVPKVIRLVVQLNLLADTKKETLFYRGAAIVKLADLLVEAGYSVEIVGAIASYLHRGGPKARFLACCMLKTTSEPLDIAVLAGTVCNAGFHRTYGFRLYDRLIPWDRKNQSGADDIGSDSGGWILHDRFVKNTTDNVKVFISPYAITNAASASAWVEKCIKELEA